MARIKVCPSCQNESSPDQPFCTGCGLSLADTEITDRKSEIASSAAEPGANSAPANYTRRELPNHSPLRAVLHFPWGPVEISETLFVGRDPSVSPLADQLDHNDYRSVSRRHAEIYVDGDRVFVRDVGSTNGTYVNGVKIENKPVALSEGDQVAFSQRLIVTIRLS